MEKAEIVDLLNDKKTIVETEKTETTSEASKHQISKKESKQIRMLLSGKFDQKTPSSENAHLDDDIDYDQLNKQELVELLEEVVEEKDISKIKSQVAKIKSAFYHQNKDDIESEKQAFIAEGGRCGKI